MDRTRHSSGIYIGGHGSFWIRPTLNGKRTWKRLSSIDLDDARMEAATLMSDHARAKLGLARDPFNPAPMSVAEAAVTIGRTLSPQILTQFGPMPLDAVTMGEVIAWGTGRPTRSADIQISSLSALLRTAVQRGWIRANPLVGRPRFHTIRRHARDVMPRDADHLHQLASTLLAEPRSQSLGWQLLIAALTGCRTHELLGLRMDCAGRGDPGWIEGRYLYVRRGKAGLFPYVEITPELRACLEAHHAWHSAEAWESRWWFPGADLFRPLGRTALTQRLAGTGVTAHGLRAYYVTVWRSRGESNEQVAARIGDRTSTLIETTYGALPESWAGGEPLGWVPREGEPAWVGWRTAPLNVVPLPAHSSSGSSDGGDQRPNAATS